MKKTCPRTGSVTSKFLECIPKMTILKKISEDFKKFWFFYWSPSLARSSTIFKTKFWPQKTKTRSLATSVRWVAVEKGRPHMNCFTQALTQACLRKNLFQHKFLKILFDHITRTLNHKMDRKNRTGLDYPDQRPYQKNKDHGLDLCTYAVRSKISVRSKCPGPNA